MPSCSARVFMCASMPAYASCFVILGECACVSIFACMSVCYLILYVHAFYYMVSIKNVFAGMYSHEYNPVCMTEHTHNLESVCVCVCVNLQLGTVLPGEVFSSLFLRKMSNQPYCVEPDCFPL